MTDGRQPLSSRPRGTARGDLPDVDLRTAWTRWLGVLRARGWDPSPVLRPGAAPTAIAAAEQSLGHALPDAVRALYAITDGQSDPDEVGGPVLFPARVFCPLSRAVELRREGGPDDGWPLAEGADGALVLIDADGRVTGAARELADGLVDYLARLSVADLEAPAATAAGGAVVWDAPALR